MYISKHICFLLSSKFDQMCLRLYKIKCYQLLHNNLEHSQTYESFVTTLEFITYNFVTFKSLTEWWEFEQKKHILTEGIKMEVSIFYQDDTYHFHRSRCKLCFCILWFGYSLHHLKPAKGRIKHILRNWKRRANCVLLLHVVQQWSGYKVFL